MQLLRLGTLTAVAISSLCFAESSNAKPRRHHHHRPSRDLGHEVLAPSDGWAALEPATSGGTLAEDTQIYVVTTRAELIAALNDGVVSSVSPSAPSLAPKIIYVDGSIDFNVDDDNLPLTCADYYRNGYTPEAFTAAFEPAIWGRSDPSGPLEEARVASQQAQQSRIRVRVGSNTTLVGVGKTARLRGVWLDIRGTAAQNMSNIIIRNLSFEDTFDCFTAWSPTDGTLGAWNAQYDSISLRNSHHVWVDHNTFRDRLTADERQPDVFGVPYQVHDGALDITNASDLVTVSYNRFVDHDKVMLIGSSDSAAADRGKLRVTLHHNLFRNTGQRTPRVRFGQVDIFNNHYDLRNNSGYGYSWGVGVESAIIAENNFFSLEDAETPDAITPADFISRLNGALIHETGTQTNGARHNCHELVDVVAAYNAENDPDLSEEVGWAASLRVRLEPTRRVPSTVQREAGPFDW